MKLIAKILALFGLFYLSILAIFVLDRVLQGRDFRKGVLTAALVLASILSLLSWQKIAADFPKAWKGITRPYEIKLNDEDGLRFASLRAVAFYKGEKVGLIGADTAHDLHFARFWIYPAETVFGEEEVKSADKIVVVGNRTLEASCGATLEAESPGSRVYRTINYRCQILY